MIADRFTYRGYDVEIKRVILASDEGDDQHFAAEAVNHVERVLVRTERLADSVFQARCAIVGLVDELVAVFS